MKKKTILFYLLILLAIAFIYYNFNSKENLEIKDYIDEVEQNKRLT